MKKKKGVTETQNHIVNVPLMGTRLWMIINLANLS